MSKNGNHFKEQNFDTELVVKSPKRESDTLQLKIDIDDTISEGSFDDDRLTAELNDARDLTKTQKRRRAKSSVNLALECSYCSKKLTTKGICANQFLQRSAIPFYRRFSGMLERHFRCHFERTLCHICHKVFKSNNDMKIHLSGHDGAPEFEKKFICHICGKRFNRNADLLKHIKVHTNERPFKCPHCEKVEFNSNSLPF